MVVLVFQMLYWWKVDFLREEPGPNGWFHESQPLQGVMVAWSADQVSQIHQEVLCAPCPAAVGAVSKDHPSSLV